MLPFAGGVCEANCAGSSKAGHRSMQMHEVVSSRHTSLVQAYASESILQHDPPIAKHSCLHDPTHTVYTAIGIDGRMIADAQWGLIRSVWLACQVGQGLTCALLNLCSHCVSHGYIVLLITITCIMLTSWCVAACMSLQLCNQTTQHMYEVGISWYASLADGDCLISQGRNAPATTLCICMKELAVSMPPLRATMVSESRVSSLPRTTTQWCQESRCLIERCHVSYIHYAILLYILGWVCWGWPCSPAKFATAMPHSDHW